MAGTTSLNGLPSFLNPQQVTENQSAEERLDVSREEFFQLLIAELQSQDPLEPMNNQEFLGQLAQLETLNGQTKMTQGIEELTSTLRFSQLNQASSLLGKVVLGTTQEQALDAEGLPRFDQDGQPIFEAQEIEGIASRVQLEGDSFNVMLLTPVLDTQGLPVEDENGNIVTREVFVPLASISQIQDPMLGIAAAPSNIEEEQN